MEKIFLPGTTVEITRLAFGAWAIGGWFWGGTEENASVKAIECAIEHGMTTIDTAPVYGFGQSESYVGKAIRGRRDKVQVMTKFGLRWDLVSKNLHVSVTTDNQGKELSIYKLAGKESVIRECESSLRRLGTDYIDHYQLHWPDAFTPVEETMEALEILQSQGKILAGGVSNFTVEAMQEAGRYFPIVSNQVPYSMVLRDIERDLVPWSMAHGKAIIVYSPLQRGVLTGKITPGYRFEPGDHRPSTPYFKEPNLSEINRFLSDITPLAHQKGVSLAQLVIRWTMSQPGISCVLVGARNENQVMENIRAADISITDEEMKFIIERMNNLTIVL